MFSNQIARICSQLIRRCYLNSCCSCIQKRLTWPTVLVAAMDLFASTEEGYVSIGICLRLVGQENIILCTSAYCHITDLNRI